MQYRCYMRMATAGVGMALVVTAVWVGMVAIASGIEKKAAKEADGIKETE